METLTDRSRHARRRLERVAARRHGVFTRAHARQEGLSDSALDRMSRWGVVIRLYRGVYSFASVPASDRRAWMASTDAGGPDACLSGRAALQLLGVRRQHRRPGEIEVVVPHRHRRMEGVRFVVSAIRHAEDRIVVDGIPVLSLERLLVERAARGGRESVLCALMDEGAFQDRFSVDRMQRVLERHCGRRGHARLRRALFAYVHGDMGARSDLEARVGARLLPHVTGRFERNRPRVFGGMRMRPDIYLPDVMLVIEIDGMHGHSRPTQRRRDAERDDAYARQGVACMRIRDTREHEDTADVIREIRRRQGTR